MKWFHRHRGPIVQTYGVVYYPNDPATRTVVKCDRCGKLAKGRTVPGKWTSAELNNL